MSEPETQTALDAARARASARIDALQDDILALSHRIHANPETGFEEVRAARWVADAAHEWAGVTAEVGVGGLGTAVRAQAGSGDLVVTLCAEYDALPGIGHACGHNIIAASAVGAFAALAAVADEAGLTVRLLGTPAEENGGGKVKLLDAGVFDGTHAAMMVHPGIDDFSEMTPYASTAIDVEFIGREAHASATPHEGVNALDALTVMLTAIGLARQQLAPHQQIHGMVRGAGTAPNIIPASAGGTWMARAADLDELRSVVGVIRRCAEAGALAAGAEVRITEPTMHYAHLTSDPDLTARYHEHALQIGRSPSTAMPRGGSTDMGNVSQRFPSIHPMIGIGDGTAASLHSEPFVELAGSPRGDRAALDGARLLAWTALDAAMTESIRTRLLDVD